MGKKYYEISESPEELSNMIKKEKRGRFRDRLRLLHFLKSGQAETMTQAAELCDISRQTASDWFRRYETEGTEGLLRLKTVPGRQRSISGEPLERLKKRLADPEGFGSYNEIKIWLKDNCELDISYKTVHTTVHYYLGASPKTPRPSHIKKNEEEVSGFKAGLPSKVAEIKENSEIPVKFFSYDETRLGLITSLGKRITLKGVKPEGRIQRVFENYYIYGAVGIPDGKSLFFEFSGMNTECFQYFIDAMSEEFPDSMNVLLTDNAPVHKAKRLIIPENIGLMFLPAYSPELNPIERFWEHIKQYTKGEIFPNLESMKNYIADILKEITDNTIASLVNFPYILNAVNV